MDVVKKQIEKVKAEGAEFNPQRLELAKKDERGIPQSTGKHKVKVIRGEVRTDIRQFTGTNSYKEVEGIRVYVEENETEKFYEFPSLTKDGKPHYLLMAFENVQDGDMVVMEYVKKGDKGFINVSTDVDSYASDIPVIEEDDL